MIFDGDGSLLGLRAGVPVEPVSLWAYFVIGKHVGMLEAVEATSTLGQIRSKLEHAEWYLKVLLSDPSMEKESLVPLRGSKELAQSLMDSVQELMTRTDLEKQVGKVWAESLNKHRAAFEQVFRIELKLIYSHYVSQKGDLATETLVSEADKAIHDGLRQHLTATAKTDIRSAGRSLLFDLPTASGFHFLRALEAVIRDYVRCRKGTLPDNIRLHDAIEEMKRLGASEKLIAALHQVRAVHRNEMMHPVSLLTADDAIDLYKACTVAVNAVLAEMKSKGSL
jgi:hypothetical protein